MGGDGEEGRTNTAFKAARQTAGSSSLWGTGGEGGGDYTRNHVNVGDDPIQNDGE